MPWTLDPRQERGGRLGVVGRYVNPYTDFGFKKLFGKEASKELLRDFLNELLPPHHRIAELSFQLGNQLPELVESRSAVFDIFCQSASGERFIVEMQKAKQNYFVSVTPCTSSKRPA